MPIQFHVHAGVAVVTIDRPEKLNALDAEHYAALSETWARIRDDRDVRVAVVTGAGGRAFSTGADLKKQIPNPGELGEAWLTQKDMLLNRGLEVWKPVIAAVDGYCIGGGLTLLLATDVRFATPASTFGLSEVKRGVIPANGGTQRLVAQLPHAIAMRFLLTGEAMDAETALRWGLVNEIVPAEQLMDAAMACAHRIAQNAPLAVQASKELAIRSHGMDLQTGLRMEQVMARLLKDSEDAAEGTQAFAAKRAPVFKGR